ncbi:MULTISPECIES: type VI secretion system-associated FHA domain protein TagH [unclassified Pseudomonas]|uniref:type VI secretion system-associated FHA domain protein TagH n=1 Tax=unclassified Pseudomonas TaxID=196821 RepID=UPI000C88BFF3|nr:MULTISPECIES: type VI secretion system-associated FHA domain protein TagH [unclassified Pseudomonas]PMZ96531.1 type VI secretion system-associated FHA domain protein TagH [Pseudomonas sp. FW305-42]PNA20481.1 type VI secretion system-associated FHA domain protein TagH [Pseudomonas sp. MPR-R1B]PNB29176.1 type VI secretion system-associated FHA domain protein TagH [Pseudomonas sp. DP16D-E2]PNB44408.1 type VI secretion system-associated FHA domain protein TagH [Pseudomonas sp. FW305-17]PNB63739
MALCLTITSYHKITPGQCPEKLLENGAISVGRAADNDWVLPDPERLVSSKHCVIQFKDGRYYLTDNSTNGVELVHAGIRLRRGNSEPLMDGEVIRIGDYEIQARIDSGLSIPIAGQSEAHSFEALMANQVATPSAPIAGAPAAFLQGASSHDTLPDLFDFLGPSSVPPVSQPDHVPAQQHDFRPPTPVAPPPAPLPVAMPGAPGVIPDDWNLFDETPAPVIQPAPVLAPAPPPPLPEPLTPSEPVVQPQPVVTVAAPADSDALLQAFLRGAGIEHLRIDAVDAAAQMEAIGRSYRLMVEGLIDVLRARSSLKGEFRMQQTTIAPVQNNPLKFAPNADEALLLLLREGNQAFMAPDQAVRDSFDDLRAHQLAVMAGIEAALKHLLKRFEPARLEERLAPAAGLAKLFGGSRQAHCWQQFTELYSQISREAEDDFQDLFGREFSRAYEAHSQRIQRS